MKKIYGKVEEWKLDISNTQYLEGIKQFRRNILCGGTINFPDRPLKISQKYDGLEKNVEKWDLNSYSNKELFSGFMVLVKRLFILSRRIMEGKFKIKTLNFFDDSVGYPLRIIPYVSESSIRYWYYSNIILNIGSKANTILEVGAGYGGLCKKILKTKKKLKYIIIDLPHNCKLINYYLNNNDIHTTNSYEYFINNQSVLVLEPGEISKIICNVDIAVNTMSFQHMELDQLQEYFQLFKRLNVKFIYHVNRVEKRDPSDIGCDNYPVSDIYEISWSRMWHGNGHKEICYKNK